MRPCKFAVQTDIILAPEVPTGFQTTSRALSRSSSGDPEERRRPEIHTSSLDTLHLRSLAEKAAFFGSYGEKRPFRNECIDEDKDCESYSSRHYSARLDDQQWRYKHQIPSEHLQATDFRNRDPSTTRYSFRESETNRLDYLSLSLSPPARRNESSFYAHESLSFSPSKNVEDLNEDDLYEIAKKENEDTGSQENPRSYSIGGYVPISEGDILDDKYEVIRKLGFGQFSTVWLCQNQVTNDYVAIKLCKSQGKLAALALDEIKLLQVTNETNRDHAGFRHIVLMLDYFDCQSVNGRHTAIVLEVMGPSLLHLIQLSEYRGLEISGVRRIMKQVLQGLEYLHDECGIIHTDLKPENILIKAKGPYVQQMVDTVKKFKEYGIDLPKTYISADRWRKAQEFKRKARPYVTIRHFTNRAYTASQSECEVVNLNKQGQLHLKVPLWIDANIEVKIGDMGNATFVNDKYNALIQTRQYRALEVILDAGYDCPADLWSVGCLAFELATGEFLFFPRSYNNISLDMDHVTLIWEVLGGIPHYITNRGKNADEFFADGQLLNIPDNQLRIWKIEDVLVEKYKWKRVDAIPFAGFIESLIEPDPILRATASAALKSEWINE